MLFHLQHALRGKTLTRSLMNKALSKFRLKGKVLDLGGGSDPSYLTYFKKDKEYVRVVIDIDKEAEGRMDVDLENMRVPFEDNSVQTVLMLNLLEHIYQHNHVLHEARRVLEGGGELIGFVPFLVNVHRDPHDFFRYTDEALEKMLKTNGFSNIKIKPLGYGPFSVGYNTLVSVLPNLLFIWMLPIAIVLDRIILLLRPHWEERFPIGYLFTATK